MVWPVTRQQVTARRSCVGLRWPGGTGGQPVHRRIVAVGWPGPPAALVLSARSRGGSHRAPAARLPALCSGPPLFSCGEGKTSSHIPRTKNGQKEMAITDFLSSIFSSAQDRSVRIAARRSCPRPRPEPPPGNSFRE